MQFNLCISECCILVVLQPDGHRLHRLHSGKTPLALGLQISCLLTFYLVAYLPCFKTTPHFIVPASEIKFPEVQQDQVQGLASGLGQTLVSTQAGLHFHSKIHNLNYTFLWKRFVSRIYKLL